MYKLNLKNRWQSLKSPFLYSSSSISLSVVKMMTGVIIIRFIEPEALGLWKSTNLLTVYSFILLFGILNGLSRELPYSLGRGKDVDGIAGTSLFVVNVASAGALLIGGVYILFNINKGYNYLITLATVIVIVVMTFYRNYLIILFRSKSSFIALAQRQWLESAMVLLSLPLVILFSYEGYLIRMVAISIIPLVLMYVIRPIKARPRWNNECYKHLMKTGVPIFLLDYISTSSATFDTLALMYFSDVKTVGFYALSGIIFNAIYMLPKSISQYIYPRMTYKFGQSHQSSDIGKLAFASIFGTFLILIPVVISIVASLPFLVNTFFPKYSEGIFAAQIISISVLFVSSKVGVNALLSLRLFKFMSIYQIGSAILHVLCPLFFVWIFEKPLTGVAFGMSCARFLNFIIAILLIYKGTYRSENKDEIVINSQEATAVV